MCDCYWPKCERCDAQVPLHISDFCMTRDEVAVFCAKHIPRRDAVVYEIVSEAFQPGFGRGDDFYHEPPKGWRMAVRYKRPPPKGYDLQAAEPNSASDYLAEYRSPTGARRFFGHCFSRLHRSERAAALDALTDIADRRERFGRQDPAFQAMLAAQQRIWESVKKQSDVRARLDDVLGQLELVQRLRQSGNLLAVALIGSLRNRDFVPELSDIDLWVLGRRLKPGLKSEHVKSKGLELEVNLLCRNPKFLRRALREGNPVDLTAVRNGEALHDTGLLRQLRRRAGRYRAQAGTRRTWMETSARRLSMAIQQYFSPDCPCCFFGALYHAARDLLRAHWVAQGGDLLEGWEVEEAAMERWPDLAEEFGRIRYARTHWESFKFPLFEERDRIEGELGRLVLAGEAIARPVYRGYGLSFPKLESFFEAFRRRGAKRFSSVHILPDKRIILVSYTDRARKLKMAERKMRRVPRPR